MPDPAEASLRLTSQTGYPEEIRTPPKSAKNSCATSTPRDIIHI